MKTKLWCMIVVLGAVSAACSEPVDDRFGFDEPASIEWIMGERIEIDWKQIDDSRCAAGATCVWEGYRIQLVAVGPYPLLDAITERSSCRATSVVSPVTQVEMEHGLDGLNTNPWRLEAFGPIGQQVPALASTEVTMLFDVTNAGLGTVSGSGGCNGFTGAVQVAPIGAIELRDLGFTDMACVGAGLMEQEERFFTELPNVIGFTMTETSLILPYAGDDIVGTMIFGRGGDTPTAVEAKSWGQVKVGR